MSSRSLGIGDILDNGEILFTPFSPKLQSPLPNDKRLPLYKRKPSSSTASITNASTTSVEDSDEFDDKLSESCCSEIEGREFLMSNTPLTNNTRREKLKKTYFIRSSDLGLEELSRPAFDYDEQKSYEFRPSPLPPLDEGSDELWVAINETCDSPSFIFPYAISSLMEMAMDMISDPSKWILEKRAERLLRSASPNEEYKFRTRGPAVIPNALADVLKKETLVWSSPDIHAFRSEGIIEKSPKAVFDMLMDSARVKEYNKQSEGRTDLFHFSSGRGDEEATTKVVAGTNRAPLIRISIPFMTLFHGKSLNGEGYIILNRSVKEMDMNGKVSSAASPCDTVVGVTLILSTQQYGQKESNPNQSLVINMNHVQVYSAMKIPKAVGVRGAIGFFSGMRSVA